MNGAAVQGVEARLQAFFVEADGPCEGLHAPVLFVMLLQQDSRFDQALAVGGHGQVELLL